jgi:hypothetical protein
MFHALGKFLRWVFDKFAFAGAVVGLGIVAGALWLFLKDNVDFDAWWRGEMREFTHRRDHTKAALADTLKEMDRLSAEISAEQERGKQADKIIAQLRELESTWDRVVGNPEQQKANAAQMARMGEVRIAATKKVAALKEEFTRKTWTRDGLELALDKANAALAAVEARQSRAMHYLERAWERLKFWVVVTLAVYFLGPTAGKLALYYGLAPMVMRGRPVRLEESLAQMPEIAASAVSAELALRPGERLRVKEKFLQASDEGGKKQTRLLLDWRIPFTCAATGLVELVELGGPRDAGELRVTLTHHEPYGELSVVTLGEGAALVLRPSFLVGVVVADGGKFSIRRRWQLHRWQSWVTLQFRFFEFSGPCRLIVVGRRGVRAERLDQREGDAIPARRANQDATIGFTPNLEYRPTRAETFWGYYRGANPLFDDLFVGRGVFLCQQVSTDGETAKARRFWGGLWGGAMKVFGV